MIGADMVGRKGDLPLRTARLPENGMGKSQRLFGRSPRKVRGRDMVVRGGLTGHHVWLLSVHHTTTRSKVRPPAPSLVTRTICWYSLYVQNLNYHTTPPDHNALFIALIWCSVLFAKNVSIVKFAKFVISEVWQPFLHVFLQWCQWGVEAVLTPNTQ